MFTNMSTISGENTGVIVLCISLAIWELVRKGIALYRAGQKNDLVWFIFIFIFNTCGILPIIYLILDKKENY